MSANQDAATRAHFTARAATYAGGGDESLRVLLAMAAARLGERALDVATGTGMVLFELAGAVGRGGLAVGLDFTPAMLAQAATRRSAMRSTSTPITTAASDAPRMGGPALLAADAARLPFMAGCFDIVTCRFSVHHMSDPAASLAAMAAVLRPGGRLAIADFVRPDDHQDGDQYDRVERLRGHEYVQIYQRAQLEQMLAGAGCPVTAAQLVERVTSPSDIVNGPNVAPQDRDALNALVKEITQRGGGGGFEVRGVGSETKLGRVDIVLLGVKGT